jgi:putative PIN family toxin of toxin-antitoxin system
MQKIILDTNVLVSALIQKSYPYLIFFSGVLENKYEVCISDALMKEYLEVINRPKFSKYPDFLNKAEFVIAQIESFALRFDPKIEFDVIVDSADNRLLELAFEAKADFLITGNTSDFTMVEFEGTRIINPKDFWEDYA